MNILKLMIVLLFVISPYVHGADYREISWDDLMPKGWMPPPIEPVHDFFGDGSSSGQTPGGQALEGQASSDDLNPINIPVPILEPAPIVQELDKLKLRIPGYVIPIKYDDESISEFLLVPYVGACIHVPPPPENQIIYVKLSKPLMTTNFWEPVWVNGDMKAQMSMTKYATAGYQLENALAELYEY
jgi:hypothetical protein